MRKAPDRPVNADEMLLDAHGVGSQAQLGSSKVQRMAGLPFMSRN